MIEMTCPSGDPSSDFWAVREELRMYNPAYCEKPYIVALNKMDLPDARELEEEVRSEVQNMAASLKVQYFRIRPCPQM